MTNRSGYIEHLEMLLMRYLGEDVARQIIDNPPEGGVRLFATVLFADIRAFTAMTESADPLKLLDELNDYYEMIDEVIVAYGGVINTFGGDSVLALFGHQAEAELHADTAVVAAGRIMDALADLNTDRIRNNRPPFRIGIGVNTGSMAIGNLGSRKRWEFTVIGDCVNVAKRLSDMSKETPFYSIFAGQGTVNELKVVPKTWEIDNLGEIYLKGRQQPIMTYAVTPDDSYPLNGSTASE